MIASIAFGSQTAAASEVERAEPALPDAVTVNFSTFTGGSGMDVIRDVVSDPNGNVYVTGGTESGNFKTNAGAYDTSHNGWMDVFVMKLSPDGKLLWSTFLGGSNYDRAYSIEVDPQGAVYVAGRAGPGFPTTSGVIQSQFGGDSNPNSLYGDQDGFVTKISPDGSQVIWSTYFGGNDRSFIRDIDVDDAGKVVLALTSVSKTNPHITSGAYQSSLSGGEDGVVARLAADGKSADWATYFGGSGAFDLATPSIRVDNSGNVYIVGGTSSTDLPTSQNAFDRSLGGQYDLHLAKFSANGSFQFGTYIGGAGNEFSETHALTLDNQGNPIVAATTTSDDFPTTSGAFQTQYGGTGGGNTGGGSNYPGDGFIAKFSTDGSRLLASTYLGGQLGEGIEGVGVDSQNNVYASGATYSGDFPVTGDAYQAQKRADADFFAVQLSADFSRLVYSTYLGGRDTDFGRTAYASPNGTFYVAGETYSSDWPVVNPLQGSYASQMDGVLVKLASSGSAPLPPTNQAPSVSAGPDQTIGPVDTVSLNGNITDDGLPNPPAAVTAAWIKVSGPGRVRFNNNAAVDTTATFTELGTYVLRLTADDGAASRSDEVTVNVVSDPPPPPTPSVPPPPLENPGLYLPRIEANKDGQEMAQLGLTLLPDTGLQAAMRTQK